MAEIYSTFHDFPQGFGLSGWRISTQHLTIPQGFWLSDWFKSASAADKAATFGEAFKLFAQGKLDCPVDGTFSIDQLAEAITAANTPGRSGKVMLKM